MYIVLSPLVQNVPKRNMYSCVCIRIYLISLWVVANSLVAQFSPFGVFNLDVQSLNPPHCPQKISLWVVIIFPRLFFFANILFLRSVAVRGLPIS